MNNLKNIIKQSIDMHMHIGPEIIPRKYNIKQLANEEVGNIGGFVLKNHFYPTTPFIRQLGGKKDLKIYGSVTLNNFVGGLNPEAITSTAMLTKDPIVVWLPTINAENFLAKSSFEIAPEWINRNEYNSRRAKNTKPVKISVNQLKEILIIIKKVNAVLATGHISWQETVKVVNIALELNLNRIIITHPIYQKIDMPINIQKELARMGCYIEHCYSMFSIDRIGICRIVEQIKGVGPDSIILSSDVGQTFSYKPSKALLDFARLLRKDGIKEDELFTMLVANPKKILSNNS
jgi:hypothetical protein